MYVDYDSLLPLHVLVCSYNDVEDEHRATNLLITADEAFVDIKVSTLGVSCSLSLSFPLTSCHSNFHTATQ